jgi:hypothetical protein
LGPLILIVLFIGVLAGGLILHFKNENLKKAIKIKKQQLIQLQQEIKSYQSERIGKQVIKNEHKRLVGFIPTRENQEEFMKDLLDKRLTYGHIVGSPEFKKGVCGLYENM